ncbi:MAG: alpha/beta hydrolase [Anaerolineae bacterium]
MHAALPLRFPKADRCLHIDGGGLGLTDRARLFVLVVILLFSGCKSGLMQPIEAGDGRTPTASASPTESSPTPLSVSGAPATSATDAAPIAQTTETPLTPSATPLPAPTGTPFVCPYLHGRTEIGALTSEAMGEQVRFLVHLPPCYDQFPTKAFPSLYLFHGWPLNEWHWDDLGMDEWTDDWTSRGLAGPFILIMPGVGQDGRYVNSSGGDGSFEGLVVNELVPHIDNTYRTVSEPWGRGVSGISRGGVWALEIAMRHQDLFGSVGGHSPALALNRPLPAYDPYLLAREDISGLRFYLDAGDGDWARAGTIRFRDLLLEVGADVTYDVHEGGHVDELWRRGIPDYLAFHTKYWPVSYQALPEWVDADHGTPPDG